MSMEREYHEIGEVFEYNGMRLKTLSSNNSDCDNCALNSSNWCDKIACAFNHRCDHNDVFFAETTKSLTKGNHVEETGGMVDFFTNGDYIRLKAQVAVLKEVRRDYAGQTIDSIIRQMEAKAGKMEKGGRE